MTIHHFTGFAASAVAVLGFGSNFVPVKKYEMGDGMMFQLIMPLGIWIFGLFYSIVRSEVLGNPIVFHPMAMLGGVIWCFGNIMTVPIIKVQHALS